MDYVVLDRIAELPQDQTPYCVHGRTVCSLCKNWCWLGDRTYQLLAGGEAMPLCKQCANAHIPRDRVPATNVGDHRRADGPH